MAIQKNNGNKLQASEASPSSSTSLFHILSPYSDLPNNSSYQVRLLSQFNNKFLTVNSSNYLVATQDNMDNATVFTLSPTVGAFWTLQSTTSGKYASTDSNLISAPVVVNRDSPAGWERFSFTVLLFI